MNGLKPYEVSQFVEDIKLVQNLAHYTSYSVCKVSIHGLISNLTSSFLALFVICQMVVGLGGHLRRQHIGPVYILINSRVSQKHVCFSEWNTFGWEQIFFFFFQWPTPTCKI